MAFIILEKHAFCQENYYIQLAVADMDQLIPTLLTEILVLIPYRGSSSGTMLHCQCIK